MVQKAKRTDLKRPETSDKSGHISDISQFFNLKKPANTILRKLLFHEENY